MTHSRRHLRRDQLIFEDGHHIGDYVIVHRDGKVEHGRTAEPISSGGAGVIYRARYKDRMERAIKVLCPRDDLSQQLGDLRRFESTFESEIALLSTITHTNIAKIMDFGTLKVVNTSVPYYALEYIDGVPLNRIWENDQCTAHSYLSMLDQVLGALEYLHEPLQSLGGRSIMHGDVKEANVIVRMTTNTSADLDYPSVYLLDLGASKIVSTKETTSSDLNELGEATYFVSTQRITYPAWQHKLNHEISRGELNRMFPQHDLYALGVLIRRSLELRSLAEMLRRQLGSEAFRALQLITDRLESMKYNDVSQLRRDWRKLRPEYLSPLRIPELALAPKTSVPAPLGRIGLTDRILNLINHPMLQRLRAVPQLEFASLIYPGATHTRLLQAITNFDLARQYLSHLLNDPVFRLMVEPKEITATLLWALLNDIGYYPLSHMFEDIDVLQYGVLLPSGTDLFWSIVHPDAQPDRPIVQDYSNIVKAAQAKTLLLQGQAIQRQLLFSQVLSDQFSDGSIASLASIREAHTSSHRILAGVMLSAIGVYRAAYLVSDSMMSGVRFGLGIDFASLLMSLSAPHPEDMGQGTEPIIAIRERGLASAESMVLARLWMLERVYWHKSNRAVMSMVKFVIESLFESRFLEFSQYFRETLFDTEVEATKRLSDWFDEAVKLGSMQFSGSVRNPLHGLVDGNRLVYRRLLTISRGSENSLEERLYDRIAGTPRADQQRVIGAIAECIQAFLGQNPVVGDVLLDVPVRQQDDYTPGTVLVYLQGDPEHGRRLYSGSKPVSHILANVKEAFDSRIKKCRIFLHPEIYERLEEEHAVDRVQIAVRESLFDHYNLRHR